MKTVVTHIYPDADAITAVWLIKRYLPGWQDAPVKTVPAGETLDGKPADADDEVFHVDTGLGRFDHHQKNDFTCAARLVYQYLKSEQSLPQKDITALDRLVNFINAVDHFQEVFYPQAEADRYDFSFYQLVEGLNHFLKTTSEVLDFCFIMLDVFLRLLKTKIDAETEIKRGLIFKSQFGRSLAMETANSGAIKLALKLGYALVVVKNPKTGHARIKTQPSDRYDLSSVYRKIMEVDKKGTWFLHISHHMLLNGSSKHPHFIATGLSLPQLIAIIKKV